MKGLLRSSILCSLALGLSSCTIGFDRDWKKAAASPDTKNRNGLSGAWEGRWQNEQGRHEGGLWAIATLLESSTPQVKRYKFRYKATWGHVFSGVFTTEHEATRKGQGEAYTLGGGKDLGMLGGKITFTGTATPSEFQAQYHSKANTGAFHLKRPK